MKIEINDHILVLGSYLARGHSHVLINTSII